MNFKKYHVSRNLFDPNFTRYHMGKGTNNRIGAVPNGAMFCIKATPNTNYTIKVYTTDSTFVRLYLSDAPIVEGVSEIYNVISESETVINPEVTITNTKYVYLWMQVGGAWYTEHGGSSIMLNTGSEALPYEPYSSEVWHDTPHYIHNTSTDTITTLPAVIYPTDTTATVGLKGNTVQSSTPSPISPIMPQGTGERTGNLVETMISGCNILSSGTLSQDASYNMFIAKIQQGETYSTDSAFIGGFFTTNPTKGSVTYNGERVVSNRAYFTAPIDGYVAYRKPSSADTAMINTGSTPLPYEPYGYKIPISSANTTTPIYLGEVETTRRVKKLVLTGEETLTSGSVIGQIRAPLTGAINSLGCCTHYILKTSYGGAFPYIRITSNVLWFELSPDGYETKEEALADFKSYLAAQYAAGTPVTVWYVLTTPETVTINEPLMKIGDYADEVSGVSIPVTAGGDTISVDTTVQPSEVSATYKGWHPVADVHEAENGQWD